MREGEGLANPDPALKYFAGESIISPSDLIPLGKEGIMRAVLDEVHKFKINCNEKERGWGTRIPDPAKPRGARQVEKQAKEQPSAFLVNFYGAAGGNGMDFGGLSHRWVGRGRAFTQAKNKPLSPSAIERTERGCERRLPFLAGYPLPGLEAGLLEGKLMGMARRGNGEGAKAGPSMKGQCFKRVWTDLKGMFDYGMRNDFIGYPPLIKVGKKAAMAFCGAGPAKAKADEGRALSAGELAGLMGAIKAHQGEDPRYTPGCAIELAMLTGMGRGGACSPPLGGRPQWADAR